MRPITPDVRLIAYERSAAGLISIVDIVETSNHYASHFTRRWMRDPAIHAISAHPYGVALKNPFAQAHVINREAHPMTTKHRTRKDEWTVLRLEKEEASPGYRWLVHSDEVGKGEHYFGTKTEALAFVRKQQGGNQ